MARVPSPGQLDQRVWIDARTETRSSSTGEIVIDWTPEAEVWARVEPLQVREFFAAQGINVEATHRVTIRNRRSLTARHRFRWGGRPMKIVGPLDAGSREPYLYVLCAMGVTDGR